jgi:hypothetical protein
VSFRSISYGAKLDFRIAAAELAMLIFCLGTSVAVVVAALRRRRDTISIAVAFLITCTCLTSATWEIYRSYYAPTSIYTPDYFEKSIAKEEIDRIRGVMVEFQKEKGRLPNSQVEAVKWCPTLLPFLLPKEGLPVKNSTIDVTDFVNAQSEVALTELLERDGKFAYMPTGIPLKRFPFKGDRSPLILYSRLPVVGEENSVATEDHVGLLSRELLEQELADQGKAP